MSMHDLREALERHGRHVCSFLILGDPNPDLSVQLAVTAVEQGVTMLELGMPFSDPCADGPAVQEACGRAAAADVSTEAALEILGEIHSRCPGVPKNLLVYGNLVHARGYRKFCEDAADAGASSLLVPDIPLEESRELSNACSDGGLAHVQLIGPRTTTERLMAIDAVVDGFLYLAAHQGITGANLAAGEERASLVGRVVGQVRNPVCLGFGLTSREDLSQAFDAGARMAVVGSRLARVIAETWPRGQQVLLERFGNVCRELSGREE